MYICICVYVHVCMCLCMYYICIYIFLLFCFFASKFIHKQIYKEKWVNEVTKFYSIVYSKYPYSINTRTSNNSRIQIITTKIKHLIGAKQTNAWQRVKYFSLKIIISELYRVIRVVAENRLRKTSIIYPTEGGGRAEVEGRRGANGCGR